MKFSMMVIVLAGFLRLSAADFGQSVLFLKQLTEKLDESGISLAAGFVSYLEKRLPQMMENYDKETNCFIKTGICEISESVKQFSLSHEDTDEVCGYLDSLISDFVKTADSVISGDKEITFAEKLADSAKNSFYNLEETNSIMYIYGMRTWYPETGATKTIMGITKFYPGWLSCAYTVSAFFKGAGKSIGSIGSVTDLTAKLSGKGWKTIYSYDDVERGDVIFWKDSSARHIGVYLGWGTACSNSSFIGTPVIHAGSFDFGGKPFYRAYRSCW